MGWDSRGLTAYHRRKIDDGDGCQNALFVTGFILGPICNRKFFRYRVLGTDFKIFALFVSKQYDHPCLNLNNYKISRPTPIFLIRNCSIAYLLYVRPLHDTPKTLHHFWVLSPENATFNKVAIFDAPMNNMCKGLVSQLFQRFTVYQTGIARVAPLHFLSGIFPWLLEREKNLIMISV